ncbi:MAG: hypothetical protein EBU84_00675, partial [Actinobacteria bacterium]|nr:hypothetical protein [Actinomycetota bacterium]
RIEALNRGNAAAERILCEAAGVESGRDVLEWIVAAKDRINRLEDIINRAHLAFFSDSSHRKVSIAMHRILDEEVRKETL